MAKDKINHVISQWVRLGAMFNVSASREEVDVEQLLLETARCAAGHSRLFILAVTWLVQYGEYVAKHRLARLIRHELEDKHRQTIGLMLDLAREKGDENLHRFNQAIEACGCTIDQRPLLDIDRRNDFFVRAARKNASALSLKWGRWIEDFEPKGDAIRPAAWIIQHNRSIQWRADFKGDLRASILAELDTSPRSEASRSELARSCGATRAAITEALRKLELSDRIHRQRRGNCLMIRRFDRNVA